MLGCSVALSTVDAFGILNRNVSFLNHRWCLFRSEELILVGESFFLALFLALRVVLGFSLGQFVGGRLPLLDKTPAENRTSVLNNRVHSPESWYHLRFDGRKIVQFSMTVTLRLKGVPLFERFLLIKPSREACHYGRSEIEPGSLCVPAGSLL